MGSYVTQLVVGAIGLAIYLMAVLFVGSAYIRRSNSRWLHAHQAALRGRLLVQISDSSMPVEARTVRAAVEWLLPPVEALTSSDDKRASGNRNKDRAWSVTDWIGSREIAEWVRLHEAQRLEVWRLPDAAVQARFARAMGQIEELPPLRQNAWQRRWTELQDSTRAGACNDVTRHRWRAELSQLLAELFNARDSTYNQLVSLYGKAGWLMAGAYVAVVMLLIAGYAPVLLAGFLGGLVSRIQKVIYAKGWPTAYGASWIPLFLAPLLGALAAWAGLHVLALLRSVGVVDLAAVIGNGVTFRDHVTAAVLGLALVLGFSERLLNRLGAQAEEVITGATDGGSPASAGSTTASFPTPGPQQASNGAGSSPNGRAAASPPDSDEVDGPASPAGGQEHDNH